MVIRPGSVGCCSPAIAATDVAFGLDAVGWGEGAAGVAVSIGLAAAVGASVAGWVSGPVSASAGAASGEEDSIDGGAAAFPVGSG
jgi:hypothetical protein